MTPATRVSSILLAGSLLAGCALALEPAAQNPPVPETVTAGGTLRIGITRPASIDPAQAYDAAGQLVVSAMCDPLVEIEANTGRAHAGLSKHTVPESDGGGVTITLKDDLRFSDGSEAVVKDVRAALSRVASDSLASPLADELRKIGGFAQVHGDVAVEEEGDPNRTTLQGTIQVTKKVFTVGLAEPDSEFLNRLSRPWTAVVPRHLSARTDFPKEPICIGPYRLAEPWTGAEKEIRLVRSAAYHAYNEHYTGGGRGYPDEVVFRIYASPDAAYQAVLAGEADAAQAPASKLGAALDGARVTTAPTPSMEYVGLPNAVAPFDDPRVRLALSLALDRRSLLTGLQRHDRIAAESMLPPTLPPWITDLPACTTAVPAEADLARAKALLEEAGVSLSGVEVPFYFNDDKGSGNKALMAAVADQWRLAFGMKSSLAAMSWEDYSERATSGPGFDGPFRASWSSTAAAPGGFMTPLFQSASIGTSNWSRFTDVEFDREYERSVVKETDDGVRQLRQRELMTRVCEQLPMVPVWTGTQSYVVSDRVDAAAGGLQRRTSGNLNIRELYVREP